MDFGNNFDANVLIVDDQDFTHPLIQKALKDLGLNFESAYSGLDAIKMAEQERFFLILMDLRMPGMDGLETAERIRSLPGCSHIPIIFITAAGEDEGHEKQAYELGAVDFLYKPVSRPVLRSKVKVFLELHRKSWELEQRSEQYKDLLEAIAEGLVTLDMHWKVVEANEYAAQIFGLKLDKFIGSPFHDCIADNAEEHLDAIDETLERSVSFRRHVTGRRTDATTFPMELRGSVFMSGGTPLVLTVVRNLNSCRVDL